MLAGKRYIPAASRIYKAGIDMPGVAFIAVISKGILKVNKLHQEEFFGFG
jgi:hypothetical protein